MIEVKHGLKTVDVPYTIRLYGITEEMFDELVDEDTKAELLDGVMVVHSPATIEHDDVGGFLRGPGQGGAGAVVRVFGAGSLKREGVPADRGPVTKALGACGQEQRSASSRTTKTPPCPWSNLLTSNPTAVFSSNSS